MSRGNPIEIVAKSIEIEAIVSVREKESIRNLRALVAVRFKQDIEKIVLVFAGRVLRDAGTIDCIGITSGVNVHVVCRRGNTPSRTLATVATPPKQIRRDRLLEIKLPICLKWKGFNPDCQNTLLKRRPVGSLRTNVKCFPVFVVPINTAQLEYERRRRDMLITRMELYPGGRQILRSLNSKLRNIQEDIVAMNYQQFSSGSGNNGNLQRGLENKEPMPNPWKSSHNKLNQGGFRAYLRDVLLNLVYTYLQLFYREQLKQLITMGYNNNLYNICALVVSAGCLKNAIKLLKLWDR